MQPYLTTKFHNPSATYLAGRDMRKDLDAARASVATVLGAKPAEITFTAGATEANNLAIQGVIKKFPDGEVVVSSIEHESVLAPTRLFKQRILSVNAQGIVDVTRLKKLINDKTVLISIMMASNEIGSLQPLREISAILRQIRISRSQKRQKRPIYLHTDAAQAPCYLDIRVSRLGVDLMSLNGGKIYGPKQSGILYVKAGIKLQPLIWGGGQESGLRSGTENVANYVGLAKALSKASQLRQTESTRISSLRQRFLAGLESLPDAELNGSHKHSVPHIANVKFNDVDNERLMIQLDEADVETAVGSACSASRQEPSHVLGALGLRPEEARSSLRFSFGRQTTEQDIDTTLRLLKKFTGPSG